MQDKLSHEEQQTLLHLAREAITARVQGEKLPPLDLMAMPESLREDGASFITLTIDGQLRGCIGALDPYQSLAEDVRQHAVAAALEDPRFAPVNERELSAIKIEVSRLTRPYLLAYTDWHALLAQLRPHIDGVILRDGWGHKGTFLPQVWEKIPDPAEFLNHLCEKMGISRDAWQTKHLDVYTYQVEEFHE